MKAAPILALVCASLGVDASADCLDPLSGIYRASSVETDTLKITIRPVHGGEHFSITLSNVETDISQSHTFEGEGSNDPRPFLLRERVYCGIPVVLLTIEYPFRHTAPQSSLVLDTYAFRKEDLAFIDRAQGPLTDIALQDDREDAGLPLDMLPPVGVHCLSDPMTKPFEFFRHEAE